MIDWLMEEVPIPKWLWLLNIVILSMYAYDFISRSFK
jgi:hypothetical protein